MFKNNSSERIKTITEYDLIRFFRMLDPNYVINKMRSTWIRQTLIGH